MGNMPGYDGSNLRIVPPQYRELEQKRILDEAQKPRVVHEPNSRRVQVTKPQLPRAADILNNKLDERELQVRRLILVSFLHLAFLVKGL